MPIYSSINIRQNGHPETQAELSAVFRAQDGAGEKFKFGNSDPHIMDAILFDEKGNIVDARIDPARKEGFIKSSIKQVDSKLKELVQQRDAVQETINDLNNGKFKGPEYVTLESKNRQYRNLSQNIGDYQTFKDAITYGSGDSLATLMKKIPAGNEQLKMALAQNYAHNADAKNAAIIIKASDLEHYAKRMWNRMAELRALDQASQADNMESGISSRDQYEAREAQRAQQREVIWSARGTPQLN